MKYINPQHGLETLKLITQVSPTCAGAEYLRAVCKNIAAYLQCDLVFIAHLQHDQLIAHTDALCIDGQLSKNLSYHLAQTPSIDVIRRSQTCLFENDICQIFPNDKLLTDLAAASYIGVPIVDPLGDTCGLLVAVGRTPLKDAWIYRDIFEILAVRISTELMQEHIKENIKYQVSARTSALAQSNRQLKLAYDELSCKNKELERNHRVDFLTGVSTRENFLNSAKSLLSLACRHKNPCALLFIDLDRFKSINDTYGHSTGDIVLRFCSDLFSTLIREEDIIGRYGGEEFLLILPMTNAAEAKLLARRITSELASHPIIIEDSRLSISCSIGASCAERHGYDLETLIGVADKALYTVKKTGRNGYHLAHEQQSMG